MIFGGQKSAGHRPAIWVARRRRATFHLRGAIWTLTISAVAAAIGGHLLWGYLIGGRIAVGWWPNIRYMVSSGTIYWLALHRLGILGRVVLFWLLWTPATLAALIVLPWMAGRAAPVEIHVRGPRRLDERAAARAAGRKAGGVRLGRRARLRHTDEALGILIIGGQRSGKTVLIRSLVAQALRAAGKVILHDKKGEFISILPNPILLSPGDSRSAVWDLAADLQNAEDVREFCVRLIPTPAGKDEFWPRSARAVLAGALNTLKTTKGNAWSWGDLSELLAPLQLGQAAELMRTHDPEAAVFLSGQSKSGEDTWKTVQSFLAIVHSLARVWRTGEKVSLLSYICDAGTERRPTERRPIVLASGAFPSLSKDLIASMVGVVAARVTGPIFSDNERRRVWFFLDELPQIGHLEHLPSLLEVGRSRGVRLILAAQSISQLRDIYGENQLQSWVSMCGTKLVGRAGGADAKWLADFVLGHREVDRRHASDAQAQRDGGSISYGRHQEPTVHPADLESLEPGHFFLKTPWAPDVYTIRVPYAPVAQVRLPFVPIPPVPPAPTSSAGKPEPEPEPQNKSGLTDLSLEPPKLIGEHHDLDQDR